MKLLTVTVPCYNSAAYMRSCIDSLLTGGDRVEIIIIDDGSKDETGSIADEYAAEHPTIVKVIHQENGGHGEGINQGLRAASGKYFKVVDSDDCVSGDFPNFLDKLEKCEENGGVDLFVTNYYYVHSDGKGDRAINYSSALPTDRIVRWSETKPFRIHQMLTIHSCTFRTEVMRKSGKQLPKHTFYEDNYMICLCLPYVETIFYMNADLYRYTIGREGQSVQENVIKGRYAHQIKATVLCFESYHIDDIADKKQKKYMIHELFMMFGISIFFTRLNKTDEADAAIEKMWDDCRSFDKKYADHFRYHTTLRCICLRGKFGRTISEVAYRIANKVVRFN